MAFIRDARSSQINLVYIEPPTVVTTVTKTFANNEPFTLHRVGTPCYEYYRVLRILFFVCLIITLPQINW